MAEKSDLQALLDRAVAEAEERGIRRGVAQERARVADAARQISGVYAGQRGVAGLIVSERQIQALDGTLGSALLRALGLEP